MSSYSNYYSGKLSLPGSSPILASMAAQYGPEAMDKAARTIQNWWRSRSHTKTYKKRKFSGTGVTRQYDHTTQYVKRRMPRRRRRRWVRFVKRVHAANGKALGTKTVIRNSTIGTSWSGVSQVALYAILYGNHGTDDGTFFCGARDLKKLSDADNQIDQISEKMMFHSGVLDITARNMGDNQLEVDLYTVLLRTTEEARSDPPADVAIAENVPSIGGLTGLTLGTRGVTPFDLPQLARQGWRIVKKEKYFLAPDDTFTKQMRDPRNHFLSVGKIQGSSGDYTMSKMTKMFILVVKNVVGSSVEENANEIQVGVTRKYMYKVMTNNQDADGVLT